MLAFGRGMLRNRRDPAARRFALIFLIPLVLAALNVARSYGGISTPLYHISVSVGILATIFMFALNYLASRPETTSLLVKFSGAVLTSVLSVFGVAAWLVTPAYAAQYRPAVPDQRSIRFAPNSAGGYDVAEIPFHFETAMGRKLEITDESRNRAGYVQLAFNMPFFDRTYSQLFVSNNGLVSFGEPVDHWSLEYRLSRAPIFLPSIWT